MGKVSYVGKAVTNGILAAYLAKNGFTGTESIIDGMKDLFMLCQLKL